MKPYRIRPKIRMDKDHWHQGFDAGRSGEPDLLPPGVDVLSWHSGYIKGQGDGPPPPKDEYPSNPWYPAGGFTFQPVKPPPQIHFQRRFSPE